MYRNRIIYELSKAPFDVNVAKMIQDGEIDGEIITTDGQEVRVIRWDAGPEYPIIALIKDRRNGDRLAEFSNDGKYRYNSQEHKCYIILRIPDWMLLKDGDLIGGDDDCIFLLSGKVEKKRMEEWPFECLFAKYQASLIYGQDRISFKNEGLLTNCMTKASPKEYRRFLNILAADKSEQATNIYDKYFTL